MSETLKQSQLEAATMRRVSCRLMPFATVLATLATFFMVDNLWMMIVLLTLIAAGTYARKGPFWRSPRNGLGAADLAVCPQFVESSRGEGCGGARSAQRAADWRCPGIHVNASDHGSSRGKNRPAETSYCCDRGRDEDYSPPPAQIRTGPIKAYGSHLGW